MTRMAKGRLWNRNELIVAMNLYCKLPFGQLHYRNPVIIRLAERLGRTPGSVAMKLCNLASLDPVQQARGISGLSGASAADKAVWEEFHHDWERLAFESEQLLAKLTGQKVERLAEIDEADLPRAGLERERIVRTRVNQHFFRATVLAAYDFRCCLTGLGIAQLLVASHIIPWAADQKNRMNPRNGLCLNALHDGAFDRGLMWLDDGFVVHFSERLQADAKKSDATLAWLTSFDGQPVRLPKRFSPDPGLLRRHAKQFVNCAPCE